MTGSKHICPSCAEFAAEICEECYRENFADYGTRSTGAAITAALRIRRAAAELPEPVEAEGDAMESSAQILSRQLCEERMRYNATASRIDALEAENARLRKACEALLYQAPRDSEFGYCGCCFNARGHEADCAVALARAALGSEKK